jgi:methylated-DNA-[protein]-cysteine S-methyltransferase
MKGAKLTEVLDTYNLTDFQKKVLLATLSIKRGQTRSYRQIAEQIGHRNAYRAVGTALRKNPLPITIPCHRVVKSDGTLGMYSNGGTGRKRALLAKEGARID